MAHRSVTVLAEWSKKHNIFVAEDVGFEFSRLPQSGQDDEGEEFESRLVARADLEASSDFSIPKVLIRVPRAVILAEDTVESQAASDTALDQLLKRAAYETTREKIIACIAILLIRSRASTLESVSSPAEHPWLEYLKLLPPEVPVPTTWSDEERQLLIGTSLEASIDAKLRTLIDTLDEFERSMTNPTECQALPGRAAGTQLSKEDWVAVDAWYRSRSLEIPRSGTAMVPIIDMINHSARPTAYYDTTEYGDVVLLLKPDAKLKQGDEITISYGQDKSSAEMLFSYGFVDTAGDSESLVLPVFPEDDDPLAPFKISIFGGRPVLHLSRDEAGVVSWECPFAWLSCVNEEDGLKFTTQKLQGDNMSLNLFWQGENVTDRVRSFQELVSRHEASPLFELRVLDVVKRVTQSALDQRDGLTDTWSEAVARVRKSCSSAAAFLQAAELKLLQDMVELLDDQLTALTQDEMVMSRVLAYLGDKERAENGEA